MHRRRDRHAVLRPRRGPDAPWDKCPEDAFCPGGSASQDQHACPANVSIVAGARAVRECFCRPGFWRSCTTAGLDADCEPCDIAWSQHWVKCCEKAICVNDTLLHCPAHSSAPPGSDDCICAGGYHAEYGT